MGKVKLTFWTWAVLFGTTLSIVGPGAGNATYILLGFVALPGAMIIANILIVGMALSREGMNDE